MSRYGYKGRVAWLCPLAELLTGTASWNVVSKASLLVKASERPMQDDLVSSAPRPTTAGKSVSGRH
jgi:hypothetical protein